MQDPKSKKSTMRDVAKHAGVSVATVSRVLSGTQSVTADTRQRVDDAVTALNFVPSPAARAINSGRTHMVGALVPTLDHAIFARFLEAAEEELARFGLSLLVATTNNTPDREAARALALMELGVEGFLVSGQTRSPAFVTQITRRALPVIATSCYDPASPYPTIGYDNAAVARQALTHLRDMGHRRIGVLSGPAHNNDRTRARLASLKGLLSGGLVFAETRLDLGAAAEAARNLRARHPQVTALLCLSDVLAQGALFAMQHQGVAVPQSLSIIGIDDLPASAATCPPLTSVRLPVHDMGRIAATALANWVEEGQPAKPQCLPSELILRQSVAQI